MGFIGQTETRGSRRERQGRAVQHCASPSLSFYFLLISFFKSLLPREVRDASVLLHEVDVSLRRERDLIQVENANNVLRVWPALAAEIRYGLQQAAFVMFLQFMPQRPR